MRKLQIILLAIILFSISISAQEVSKIPVVDSLKDTQPQSPALGGGDFGGGGAGGDWSVEKQIENNLADRLKEHALDVYNQRVLIGTTAPSGTAPPKLYLRTSNGDVYSDNNGTWRLISASASAISGSGTSGQLAAFTGTNSIGGITLGGDCTFSSPNVTCTKTSGVSFSTLATTTPGTGVATALGVNIGSAGAPVLFNGAGGTPSSITLTNGSALPDSALSANVPLLNAANTFTGNTLHSGSSFGLTGNISGAGIFGTSGIRYKNVPGTLTDTTSTGTVATNYTNVFGANTLAASSATTITNDFNTYFKDPVAGSNVTLTNKWALGADSVKFGTSNQFSVGNAGDVSMASGAYLNLSGQTTSTGSNIVSSGTGLDLRYSSAFALEIRNAGLITQGTYYYGFASGNNPAGGPDTNISRNAAGVIQFGTTAANASGSWLATNGTLSGSFINSGITTDATHTDATVCEDTTTHQFYAGSGTLGICLGTSSARFKNSIVALPVGLAQILGLKPVQYRLDARHGDPNKLLYGFTAEEGGKVLPKLMGRDSAGQPNTFDYLGVVPVLTKAIQEQQAEIEVLKKEVAKMRRQVSRRHH